MSRELPLVLPAAQGRARRALVVVARPSLLLRSPIAAGSATRPRRRTRSHRRCGRYRGCSQSQLCCCTQPWPGGCGRTPCCRIDRDGGGSPPPPPAWCGAVAARGHQPFAVERFEDGRKEPLADGRKEASKMGGMNPVCGRTIRGWGGRKPSRCGRWGGAGFGEDGGWGAELLKVGFGLGRLKAQLAAAGEGQTERLT